MGRVDLATGRYEPMVQLPGFTRGLSFFGPLAFVGLSQVRESAIFSGIPLVDRLEERTCGVWVVNIESGQTVAFCRFEEGVQEIFAVELLVGVRFPDLVNHDADLIGRSYVLGDDALGQVPDELHAEPDSQFSLTQRTGFFDGAHGIKRHSNLVGHLDKRQFPDLQ